MSGYPTAHFEPQRKSTMRRITLNHQSKKHPITLQTLIHNSGPTRRDDKSNMTERDEIRNPELLANNSQPSKQTISHQALIHNPSDSGIREISSALQHTRCCSNEGRRRRRVTTKQQDTTQQLRTCNSHSTTKNYCNNHKATVPKLQPR